MLYDLQHGAGRSEILDETVRLVRVWAVAACVGDDDDRLPPGQEGLVGACSALRS